MAVNRKASAQSRNDVTFDGDSDRGGSKGTAQTTTGVCRRAEPSARHRRPRHRRDAPGAEMAESGEDLDAAIGHRAASAS